MNQNDYGLLSSRGARATRASTSYLDLMLSVSSESGKKYDATQNPNGVINLAVAENRLSYDNDLRSRLAKAHLETSVGMYAETQDLFSPFYSDMRGSLALRKTFGKYMDRNLLDPNYTTKFRFKPENLIVATGCGSLIEILAWTFCESGDAAILPAPLYAAFTNDLHVRAGVEVVPAAMEMTQDGTMELTEEALENAYQDTLRRGHRPKILLVTNPQNPLGITHSLGELEMMYKWAQSKPGMHIVADEVYARSASHTEGPVGYHSFVEAVIGDDSDRDTLGPNIHVLYGMSKDFGLSGFRVGVLYTENLHLLRCAANLCYFCCVSVDTQALVHFTLSDKAWVDGFLNRNIERLRESCAIVTNGFDKSGIPYIKPTSGLFLLVDLSKLLKQDTWEGELEFFHSLVHDTGVFLTPGRDMFCQRPGFFRVCYANVSPEVLKVAVKRLQDRWMRAC